MLMQSNQIIKIYIYISILGITPLMSHFLTNDKETATKFTGKIPNKRCYSIIQVVYLQYHYYEVIHSFKY